MINENSEKEPIEINEEKDSKKNIYSTRKKIIDFAKIGEKLSLTGSNCHFCKSIMCVQDSNACRNTEKSNLMKKKTCNKKFCYDCLEKNFPSFWDNRLSKDWKCPCCLNECPCSQCKKVWYKAKNLLEENKNILSQNEKKHHTEMEETEDHGEGTSVQFKDKDILSQSEKAERDYEVTYDLHTLLQKSKINIDKLGPIPKPKIEIIPENLLSNLKKSKEEYYNVLQKHKDKLDFLNIKYVEYFDNKGIN